MSRSITLALVTAASMAFAAPAGATLFQGSLVAHVNSVDPGLVIQTNHGPGSPGSINVEVDVNGGPAALSNLFVLWTNEGSVENDDTVAKPISVSFVFTLPAVFGGSDGGTTVGGSWLLGVIQWGAVQWNDPVTWETSFGSVTLDLDDATFNTGVFDPLHGDWRAGLDYGRDEGASISGRISAVPEPLSISLLGFGLLATGFVVRRRCALGR